VGLHARGAPDRGEPLSTGPDIDWRARAEAAEAELADRSARANEALAAAQRRTYWLDRLHLDLNALMARGPARRLVALLPLARELYRSGFHARETSRRLSGWLRTTRAEASADALRAARLSEAGEDPADAARRLVGSPAGRVLLLAHEDGSLRGVWPDAATGTVGGGDFDLVVVDDASGGLEAAAAARLAGGGRVLLATDAPAETVLDRTSFGWAVLGRRRLAGNRDLYLLRRA
jgi:hypothetical protein